MLLVAASHVKDGRDICTSMTCPCRMRAELQTPKSLARSVSIRGLGTPVPPLSHIVLKARRFSAHENL